MIFNFCPDNSPVCWAAFTAACILWMTSFVALGVLVASAMIGNYHLVSTAVLGSVGIVLGLITSGYSFLQTKKYRAVHEEPGALIDEMRAKMDTEWPDAVERPNLTKTVGFIRNPDNFWS